MCHQVLEDAPDDANALLLLALALHQQGRHEEALVTYARLTELFPDDALHWGNYATALRNLGRMDEAAKACETSLRLHPDNLEQLLNLGLLKFHARAFVEAQQIFLRAVQLAPESVDARLHAARACAFCGDYRAEQLVERWREWLPLKEHLQFELAELKLAIADATSARFLLEDLRARSGPSTELLVLLATVYERINRPEEADRLLQQLMQKSGNIGESHRSDIDHLRAALMMRAADHKQAKELLETAGPRREYDYAHYFELAEACDKLFLVDETLDALAQAHALQVSELKQAVPARFKPGAPVLPDALKRVTAQDYQRWSKPSAPDARHSPVFILGFPRSGTTLLEQMLDAHPELQSMDERPFFNLLADDLADQGITVPAELGKLGQHACDELRKGYLLMASAKIERRWDAWLVDKNPLNMLWLPMIHRLFPQAKFVLALRHPCDVLISNYMQNYSASVLAAASASIERLASAYVMAMECWLDHVEVFKPDVLVSRYEKLVADPAAQARRLADFLGLEDASPLLNFDQHARDRGFIATPSYTQVTQPINRKGLNRWHRYREALAPALPILAPMLEHWGYSADPQE